MTTFTAVFSLFLALYFVGLLATAGENTRSILQYLRSKYKIEVFFKQNVDLKMAKKVSDLIFYNIFAKLNKHVALQDYVLAR